MVNNEALVHAYICTAQTKNGWETVAREGGDV